MVLLDGGRTATCCGRWWAALDWRLSCAFPPALCPRGLVSAPSSDLNSNALDGTIPTEMGSLTLLTSL